MTSKKLFFKRFRQDIEQRVWLPILFFIVGFLALEIIMISDLSYCQKMEDYLVMAMSYLMNSFLGIANFYTLMTMGMAVVSAISGFSYMHSARKLDVYHSLPVRRQTIFWQQYIYGILYYVIPTLFHICICMIICVINGIFDIMLLKQVLGFIVVQLLIYLACYAAAVMVVCLTGNMLMNLFGVVVLSGYSIILQILVSELMSRFFVTYYDTYATPNLVAFSPVHLVSNMMDAMGDRADYYFNYTNYMGYYVKLLLMAGIYTVIALLLYMKRPTEAAEKAIVFPIAEPIVKTMIVFPAAIISGYGFSGIIMSENEFGWYAFGCIFGFLVFCPLMEIIFRRDVKALFGHPLQFVFNGVLVVTTILILQFDLLGYDSYIPKASQVESYAIAFNSTDQVTGIGLESGEEYRFHHMTITDNESTRRLLEHAAEYTRPVMTGKIPIVLNDNPCRPISVKYNLKNGKSIYRSLLIDISNEQVVQWLRDTYNDTAYKEGAYPILTYKSGEGKNYVGMILDYAYGSEKLFLSEEEMQKFVETYQEELQKLSLDEILTQVPVLRMNLAVRMPKEDMQTVQLSTWKTSNVSYDYEEAYYKIYPSFTETLTLFKEYGAKLQNEIMPEEVACIEIHDSSREINDNDGLLSKVISLSYTTENGQSEEIAQILPHLVPSQFDLGLMAESRTEPYLSVHVFYGEEGKESGLFRILKGTIPEVVEKDIEEAAKEIDG